MFTRFSRYADHPEQYGLILKPNESYRFYYGDIEELVQNMGVYYEPVGGEFLKTLENNYETHLEINKAVTGWRTVYYSENRPVLKMMDSLFGYFVYDSRPCASSSTHLLMGLQAKVYDLLWEPADFEQICRSLPQASEESLRTVLQHLIDSKLAVLVSGKYIGLAVRK